MSLKDVSVVGPSSLCPNIVMSGEQRTVIKGNTSKYVKLNVGGALYYTSTGTLTKHDNMLRAMFSGRMEVLTDSEGNKHYYCYVICNF